jgi:xanthine dehydrogenase accessory factor
MTPTPADHPPAIRHHDAIPETALAWHRAGRGVVLASVVETWGSAPRSVGSQLAVASDGEMAGSVSGGCVEGAVVTEAAEALVDGRSRLMEFGVSDETAFAVGLACGGRIRVLVEPVGSAIPSGMLADLVAARASRQPVAEVVDLQDFSRVLVQGASSSSLAARFRMDASGVEEGRFVAIHNPPLRMVVVGAVHIAQPLVVMARLAGYDCTLVDPRAAFGSAARFPGETILDEWPDDALQTLGLDSRTAVVTLTHDPKLDDPAIRAALGSDAFYIGCLGSTRTHAKRLDRLDAAGLGDLARARLHAPVGLDIGARSPAEIAISIMAQITHRLRRGG